ncbi:MAG: hypothetical protein JXQ75_03025 [Phycisphaerae bacterium]|nr:hypothetical protein [Phycisphaerae bacterium]
MLASNLQVVDVLMLVGNVAPIAMYFLVLGLVNSHSRPYLITSRADFVALTCPLVPVLLWPVPTFVRSGMAWLLLLGLLLAAVLFVWMLLTTGTGFVIYNISEARCIRLLEAALRHLGVSGSWTGRTWQDDAGRITIHLRKFALLRNVTLHIETDGSHAARLVPELGAELDRRLASVAQLPSTMGACLVLIGVGLMILPLWMVGRHIHDIVDAMSNLFG